MNPKNLIRKELITLKNDEIRFLIRNREILNEVNKNDRN